MGRRALQEVLAPVCRFDPVASLVASLVYRRTPYGQLRMDEFAGHLDPLYFQKFVRFGDVTEIEVNGAKGLWIKGPHELLYITRDGTPAAASARLTTGNTMIWGTQRVAPRLEGAFGENDALAIARSPGWAGEGPGREGLTSRHRGCGMTGACRCAELGRRCMLRRIHTARDA